MQNNAEYTRNCEGGNALSWKSHPVRGTRLPKQRCPWRLVFLGSDVRGGHVFVWGTRLPMVRHPGGSRLPRVPGPGWHRALRCCLWEDITEGGLISLLHRFYNWVTGSGIGQECCPVPESDKVPDWSRTYIHILQCCSWHQVFPLYDSWCFCLNVALQQKVLRFGGRRYATSGGFLSANCFNLSETWRMDECFSRMLLRGGKPRW